MRGAALIACVAVLLAGCGYSTKSTLNEKFRTVHVNAFHSDSREYDLQAPLTNAVIRKFINDNRLEVTDSNDADLLIEGKILNYTMKGLTFGPQDQPTQFLVVVTAAVRCVETKTGEPLWQEPLMSGETSYLVRSGDRYADRARGNTEVFASSVRSFATDEENRAATEAVEQLASDIFYRTVEPW